MVQIQTVLLNWLVDFTDREKDPMSNREPLTWVLFQAIIISPVEPEDGLKSKESIEWLLINLQRDWCTFWIEFSDLLQADYLYSSKF